MPTANAPRIYQRRCFRYFVQPRSETDADHRAIASASAARRHGLLAGAGSFLSGLGRPRLFVLGLTLCWLTAGRRIVLVIIPVARCGCRLRWFCDGDAGLALRHLSGLAFERTDAIGLRG